MRVAYTCDRMFKQFSREPIVQAMLGAQYPLEPAMIGCGARDRNGLTCTRNKGHEDMHIAHGGVPPEGGGYHIALSGWDDSCTEE